MKAVRGLLVLVFLLVGKIYAQPNLVMNPSFELIDSCPWNQGQIYLAIGWNTTFPSSVLATSDLFSPCNISMGTPWNIGGFQYPKDGNNYAGEICYTSAAVNRREYIEGSLMQQLISGIDYYVEYWVCQSESLKLSISNMGAYLSDSLIVTLNGDNIAVTPQIENPDSIILSDTMNWMKISGTFTASGGEQYIVIGNFRPDSLTNIDTTYNIPGYYNYSYYYIDMVSVIPVDSMVGIGNIENFSPSVFPNPTNDYLTIDFGSSGAGNCLMELYSLDGRLLLKKEELMSVNSQLDIRQFPPGMYVLKINSNKGTSVVKVLKE